MTSTDEKKRSKLAPFLRKYPRYVFNKAYHIHMDGFIQGARSNGDARTNKELVQDWLELNGFTEDDMCLDSQMVQLYRMRKEFCELVRSIRANDEVKKYFLEFVDEMANDAINENFEGEQ